VDKITKNKNLTKIIKQLKYYQKIIKLPDTLLSHGNKNINQPHNKHKNLD